MMGIVFRAVPGWPGFSVSRDGAVIGPSGKVRKAQVAPSGHLHITHRIGGRQKKLRIHHAVLLAWIGPCPEGSEARHLNGIPSDNRLANLAWGTRKENTDDKRRHGTMPLGERSGTSKLTTDDVRQIRALAGTKTLRELASQFGVSHTAIRRAATGRKWAHV